MISTHILNKLQEYNINNTLKTLSLISQGHEELMLTYGRPIYNIWKSPTGKWCDVYITFTNI